MLGVTGYKTGTYYLEQRLADSLRDAVRTSQTQLVRSAIDSGGAGDARMGATVTSSTGSADSKPTGASSSGLVLLSSLPVTVTTPPNRSASPPTPTPAARTATAPVALPDLRIIALSMSPPNPVRGQPVTASIKGANRGAIGAAQIPVRVDLEFEVLGKWVPIVGLWGTVETLAPGDEITMQRTASVPSQLAAGKYRVTASVDPDGKIVPFAPNGERRRSIEFALY